MPDSDAPPTGLRVIEVSGLGPAPFGCTVLADLGADVIRVDRAGDTAWPPDDPMLRRGRRSIALDLKRADHLDALLRLTDGADMFVEGFRPGVAERLGCGPEVLTSRNPRFMYARMTGWGQTGPMADLAGHDINYISVAGVLAALQGRSRTGRGDVLDVSMLEGASYLLGPIASIVARGGWSPQRHSNGLDGGAPFYGAYECADGRFVSIGPLEPQFYARLLAGLGLDDIDVSRQWDRGTWPELRRRITGAFLSRAPRPLGGGLRRGRCVRRPSARARRADDLPARARAGELGRDRRPRPTHAHASLRAVDHPDAYAGTAARRAHARDPGRDRPGRAERGRRCLTPASPDAFGCRDGPVSGTATWCRRRSV